MNRKYFNTQWLMLLCSSLLLASCSSVTSEIKSYETLRQAVDSELNSAIGSVIFRLDRSSDLPNAFGGGDIYGGKIDNGFSQVVFSSAENRDLNFTLEDVFINSTETTMDRYKDLMVVPGNNSTVVTVNNNERSTLDPKNLSRIQINLDTNRVISISGYLIRISSFDGVNLSYTISKQMSDRRGV